MELNVKQANVCDGKSCVVKIYRIADLIGWGKGGTGLWHSGRFIGWLIPHDGGLCWLRKNRIRFLQRLPMEVIVKLGIIKIELG